MKKPMKMTEFMAMLADLTLDGENFEICLAALKLQVALESSKMVQNTPTDGRVI